MRDRDQRCHPSSLCPDPISRSHPHAVVMPADSPRARHNGPGPTIWKPSAEANDVRNRPSPEGRLNRLVVRFRSCPLHPQKIAGSRRAWESAFPHERDAQYHAWVHFDWSFLIPFDITAQTMQIIRYLPPKQFLAQGIFLCQSFFGGFEDFIHAFAFDTNASIGIQHNNITRCDLRSTNCDRRVEFAYLCFGCASHTDEMTPDGQP